MWTPTNLQMCYAPKLTTAVGQYWLQLSVITFLCVSVIVCARKKKLPFSYVFVDEASLHRHWTHHNSYKSVPSILTFSKYDFYL